jgi:hypothetical protein
LLTNHSAEAPSASWSAAQLGAVTILSAVTLASAYAGGVMSESCVGTARSFNCVGQRTGPAGDPYVRTVPDNTGETEPAADPYVRTAPDALNDAEKTEMIERDQKWIARCRPVMHRDRYGVARYRYSAPGCEFGIGGD